MAKRKETLSVNVQIMATFKKKGQSAAFEAALRTSIENAIALSRAAHEGVVIDQVVTSNII